MIAKPAGRHVLASVVLAWLVPAVSAQAQVVFTATKSDALLTDVNGNGNADPGDTLRYTIFIEGTGADDGLNAFFDDTPDANTALVVGSVVTTQGAVTSGNTAGDPTVQVSIGALGGSGRPLTITFDVTVDDPLPPGVTQVVNQGTVSGTNFPSQVTDDPSTAAPNDPTITPVEAAAAGQDYFTVAPCRVVDTRGGAPIGGPALQGQETRTLAVAGNCDIPSTAKAVSINLAVTQPTATGNVRLFPSGQAVPTVSSINYAAAQTRGNNAIIPLNASGEMAAFVAQPAGTTVHLIIDVNGYFE